MDTACYKCTQYITNKFKDSSRFSFSPIEWLHFQNYIFALVLLLQEIVEGNIGLTDDRHIDDNGVIYEMPTVLNELTVVYGFWKDKEAAAAASKFFFGSCDASGCDASGCDASGCDASGCGASGCDASGCQDSQDSELRTLVIEAVSELWLSQDSEEFEEFQLSCEKIISNCKTKELLFYDYVIDSGPLNDEWKARAEALFRPTNVIYVPAGSTLTYLGESNQEELLIATSKKRKPKFAKTRRLTVEKREAIPLKRSKYPPNTRRQIPSNK